MVLLSVAFSRVPFLRALRLHLFGRQREWKRVYSAVPSTAVARNIISERVFVLEPMLRRLNAARVVPVPTFPGSGTGS